VPVTLAPNPEGLVVAVTFEGGLAPSTGYVLTYTDCAGVHELTFTTSDYGAPVAAGLRSLVGRTWHLDLVGARWVEPGGFGPVLASNFQAPVLVAVQYVDDRFVDLLGGQGYFFIGEIRQEPDEPTWDFPLSDFSEAPWFETSAPEIDLSISGYRLPITDFHLSGTFRSDGSDFGGGTALGAGRHALRGGRPGTAWQRVRVLRARGRARRALRCLPGRRALLSPGRPRGSARRRGPRAAARARRGGVTVGPGGAAHG
jgi:hypothetical protein